MSLANQTGQEWIISEKTTPTAGLHGLFTRMSKEAAGHLQIEC